jgi:saccharopine dehydrogenase-like NADP-dependent oxidoreductase
MKVIVIGGAGDMGSRAVEDLAASEGVTQVTIADRNIAGANQIAERLKNKGASLDVKGIDADNHSSLIEAMRGHDVAASALGPFYRYEPRLVRAAIEAGINYCSICDDWDAAEEVINGFDQDARKNSVTVLIGIGASPGLTNVAVSMLARQMDRVRRADVSVYLPLDMGGGPAALIHGLHIMSGQVVTWREGKRVMIPACSESRMIEFPRFGKIKVWNMGHSESATIPHFIPGIEEANFMAGLGPGASLVIHPARWGLFSTERRINAFTSILWSLERIISGGEPGLGAVRADVWGDKEGKEIHGMICGIGQMRETTGLSLSIGALMLGKKELTTKEGGVYAPEACLDPVIFLDYLKARGIQGFEDIQMTKPVA